MKEFKAQEKVTQKMTRDGAISVNLVTGEAGRVSERPQEQNYSASHDSAALVKNAVHRLDDRRVRKSEKKKRRNRRRTYREGTAANDRPSSRLQFSDEERAAPELQKVIRKSDKAADKLDAVRAAVPEKQPTFHQPVNPLARPLQEIGHAAHAKVREVEQENAGVESGHLTERAAEKAVSCGHRKLRNWRQDRKLKPWREVSHAEQAAVHAMPMRCIKRLCGKIRSLRPVTRSPGCGRKGNCKSSMPPHTGRRTVPGARRQRRRRQRMVRGKVRTRRIRPASSFPSTKRHF